MLKLSKILRDWDSTVQRLVELEEIVSQLKSAGSHLNDENRLLVSGLEGMAQELGRLRDSLHHSEVQEHPTKTTRRAGSWREFAKAASVAGKKE